jgi:pyrimidine operon attenuation protein/uracil phosphoribosyltransferase
MTETNTVLLNDTQVKQRIDRLAFQIYEDNANEKEIVIAGIVDSGYRFAVMIADKLKQISPLLISMAEVRIDKHSQVAKEISVSLSKDKLQGKVIILIDDVLNSGKTLMYSIKPFLDADIKKIRTVVLVDRNHKIFPVAADFAGYSLSTTLKEHVTVEINGDTVRAIMS